MKALQGSHSGTAFVEGWRCGSGAGQATIASLALPPYGGQRRSELRLIPLLGYSSAVAIFSRSNLFAIGNTKLFAYSCRCR
jgi:hypothetical protein